MKNWLKWESANWWPLFLIPIILTANLILINSDSLFDDENQLIFGGPLKSIMESAGPELMPNDSVIAKPALTQDIPENLKNVPLEPAKEYSDALIQKTVIQYEKPKKHNTSYFSPPASGWNWGIIHDNNAVDIANSCGAPVYASAEGIIIPDSQLGDGSQGWNNGYGLFVLIEHPNNIKTRYAHLEKTNVSIGEYVTKGKLIGYMGNTGNTHGPTGCHLHFEVLGAENPLAK